MYLFRIFYDIHSITKLCLQAVVGVNLLLFETLFAGSGLSMVL